MAPIYEISGDDEMVAKIFPHAAGFSVALVDLESGETVQSFKIFPADALDAAKAYANSLV